VTDLPKFGPVLRQISWTFTVSLRPPQRPCSSTSNASTCCWHNKGPMNCKWVRDIYNYFLLRKVRKIISWNAMFLHCTLHQCVLLVPFYSPLGNVFWPSREECHNDAWDIFMVKLWCRCRCRNIALQHITNPLMNNNSFCCSKSQVQRNHHTLWEYPYQKKKSRIATGCHSNHNKVPIHRNHDKRISRLST
jgi:hypothetical protein